MLVCHVKYALLREGILLFVTTTIKPCHIPVMCSQSSLCIPYAYLPTKHLSITDYKLHTGKNLLCFVYYFILKAYYVFGMY